MSQIVQQDAAHAFKVCLLALLAAAAIFASYIVLSILFPEQLNHIAWAGNFAGVVVDFSVVYCVVLVLLSVRLEAKDSFWKYFAWCKVKSKTLLFWILFAVIFTLLRALVHYSHQMSLVALWVHLLQVHNASMPVVLLAVLLIAPLFEELLFRGFIFTGIAESGLGVVTAILVSSYLWAVPLAGGSLRHGISIFAFGVFLGVARAVSGSSLVPFVMHMLNNLIGIIILLSFVSNQTLF